MIPKLESGKEDVKSIYKAYGSTLLGLLIAKNFVFAYQLGDGDILFVSNDSIERVIEPDRILGVETHSLCREHSWEKALTVARRIELVDQLPVMFSLSSDGYSNSYSSDAEFYHTISDYLSMLGEHGARAVSEALLEWLSETSAMGCGDDITMLIAYIKAAENGFTDTPLDSTGDLIAEESMNLPLR